MWLYVILGSKAEIKSYSRNLLDDDRANQTWAVLTHMAHIWNQSHL